jgi:COP9 signalosome complex subunit 5
MVMLYCSLIFKLTEVHCCQVMHARSGGNIEIMGLMQGKIQGDTMYVMDSFALPVEGTETRVNAQNEAYEYMVSYIEKSKEVFLIK